MKQSLLVVVLCLAVGLVKQAHAAPTKVGVLYPMSGEFAEQGQHSAQGIRLAIESLDDSEKIDFIFEDAGSDSGANLVSAVKSLIEQKKVDIVLGPGMITQALVVAPVTEKLGVPLLTSALCSPELLKYKNLVCGYPSTEDQLVDLQKIISKFKIQNLAFISDHSEYGLEVGKILDEINNRGIFRLSSKVEIDSSPDSERIVATKVLHLKPDAIFSTTQSTAVSLNLFKRLNEQGFKGTRIGFLDVDEKMLKGFGNTLKGVLLPGYVTSNYAEEFSHKFLARFGSSPDMYAAIGHDMLVTLLEALKGQDKPDLITKLVKARSSSTALKEFHFNKDRTINLPLEVLEIGEDKLFSAELN